MPCYKPLMALIHKSTGRDKATISFPKSIPTSLQASRSALTPLPCGQCIGCRLERSRQWAVRLVKEAKLHRSSSFLTLTYHDDFLPKTRRGLPTLVLEDIQLFLKRLRKECEPNRLRFFQCGEYGERTARPHHHMILFGEDFKSTRKIYSQSRSGYPQYTSVLLDKLWGKGLCTISDMSFEAAAYVARYSLKKITGKGSDFHYRGRKPEFITMSRRPGIGAQFFEKYGDDIYPSDQVVVDGRVSLPPRYFDKLLEKVDPELMARVKESRTAGLDFWNDPDSTDTRLETRERVKQALIKNCLKRNVE